MMKKTFFVLSFVLISLSSFSQDYRVVVEDEHGEALPFVHAKCERTGQYLLSNEQGVLILSGEDFLEDDVLLFESMFYEKYSTTVKALKSALKVVLQSKTLTLDAAVVRPSKSAEEMIKEMAASFAKRYAKDYAAKVLQVRTVECNGKYREFNGFQGIFASLNFTQSPPDIMFNDKNRTDKSPLTVFRSDPFMAGSDEVLETSSVNLQGNTDIKWWSKDGLMVLYHNFQDQSILDAKRTLELYAPLNSKQLKNFSYSIDSVYTHGEERIYVIRFKTREAAYPKKTRVFGQGYIHYNPSRQLPEKIIMENHQDVYKMFPRWKILTLWPSATQHRLEVNYALQEGFIYTQSVSLTVNWVDPKVENDFYAIKIQSRRNPIKNQLREYEYYGFSEPVLLNSVQIERIKMVMPSSPNNNLDYHGYYASFDREKWAHIALPAGIDRSRLERELSIPGRNLYQQAEVNGLNTQYYSPRVTEGAVARLRRYYVDARKILYPMLYHKDYE